MDPLSITATCIGLASTITSTSLVVIGFVKDVRAARSDLDAVSRELLSLKTVLELLAEDVNNSTNQSIPQTLQKQIAGIVTNCTGVVLDIEQTLKKHEGGKLNKAAKWVASGKRDVARLQLSLEAHKSALEIALDMVTLTLAREIKADTQEILDDTSVIKEDTAQILAEIARLQEQLPRDANQHGAAFMLEKYLDNLTSYAETVCDPYLDDSDGSRPISQPGSSGEKAWSNDSSPPTVHEYQERASAGPPISTTISSSATPSQAEPNQTSKLDDEHIMREAIGTGNVIQSTPATAAGLQGHENLRGPAVVEVATDVDSPASSVNITGDAPDNKDEALFDLNDEQPICNDGQRPPLKDNDLPRAYAADHDPSNPRPSISYDDLVGASEPHPRTRHLPGGPRTVPGYGTGPYASGSAGRTYSQEGYMYRERPVDNERSPDFDGPADVERHASAEGRVGVEGSVDAEQNLLTRRARLASMRSLHPKPFLVPVRGYASRRIAPEAAKIAQVHHSTSAKSSLSEPNDMILTLQGHIIAPHKAAPLEMLSKQREPPDQPLSADIQLFNITLGTRAEISRDLGHGQPKEAEMLYSEGDMVLHRKNFWDGQMNSSDLSSAKISSKKEDTGAHITSNHAHETEQDAPSVSIQAGRTRRESIQKRRARREEARKANVLEETDALSDVSELSTERTDNAENVKPIFVKGLFSVLTTSTKPVHVIRADIIRVLKQLGVEYTEIRGGFSCRHIPSINLKKVVDLPPSSHGNQTPGHRRRISFGGFMGGGNSNSLDRDREDFREAEKSPRTPRTPGRNQNRGGANNSFTNSDASDERDNSNNRGSSARVVGETSTHVQSELGRSMILEFEIFIVNILLLSLHGIQFKRLAGGTWQYKNMADQILRELRL